MTCHLKYLLIMKLRFNAILYSTLGKENSDVGHIKRSHRQHLARKYPTLDLKIKYIHCAQSSYHTFGK